MTFETGAQGRVPGDGVSLGFEWWPGPGPLVCVHGLTSHRRAFSALADELSPAIGVLSFDLRGRGDADKPDGPYGMDQHAGDVAAALDGLGVAGPVVVAGHSMGAYVVSAFARLFPERVSGVVLLDGGYFFGQRNADSAAMLEDMLAPFLQRLRTTFTSVDEVVSMFEATPLYEGRVDDAVRRYFAFDLAGDPGMLRAKAAEAGVAHDWTEIITGTDVPANLNAISAPTLLVRAPGGLTGVGDEVIPHDVVGKIRELVPHVEVADLDGHNHHSMLTTRPGAAMTAAAVSRFLDAHALP